MRLPFTRTSFRIASYEQVRAEVQRRMDLLFGERRRAYDPLPEVNGCDYLVLAEQARTSSPPSRNSHW